MVAPRGGIVVVGNATPKLPTDTISVPPPKIKEVRVEK